MEQFLNQVKQCFSDLAQCYTLSIVELGSCEIALEGKGFAIVIFKDRDGISLSYIKAKGEGTREYPLGHFLATRRRWTASNQPDRIAAELESYALTLRDSAQDILRGDEAWMEDFTTSSFPVSLKTRKALGF